MLRADNDIKFISDSNQVKNLSKIARKPKWNTSAVVLDYDYVIKTILYLIIALCHLKLQNNDIDCF